MTPRMFRSEFLRLAAEIGLPDWELADLLGVSRPTVVRWKNGRNLPCRLARKSVLNALRAHVEDWP